MSNQSYVFPRGIKTANMYIMNSVYRINKSSDDILSNASNLKRCMEGLKSLNGKYIDVTKKKKLSISISGGENFDSLYEDIKSNVDANFSWKEFDMSEIAADLEKYIDRIEQELGFNDADVRTLLFGDVRTRELGLDPILLKDSLSDNTTNSLRKYWEKKYGELTDEQFNDKLNDLMKQINNFSKKNGCGGYSLLSLINYKYKDGNSDFISKEQFFGEILIQSALNAKDQGIYKHDKLGNLLDVFDKKEGSINTKEMANICDYLNNNKEKYKISQINYKVVDDIPTGDEFENSAADKELRKNLKNGGSAIVMLKSRKSSASDSTAGNPAEESTISTEVGKEWATSRHYVAISSERSDGKVGVIDARDFNSDDIKGNYGDEYDYDDWSNLRKDKLENIEKYVQKKSKDDAEKLGYTSGQGGIIMFE